MSFPSHDCYSEIWSKIVDGKKEEGRQQREEKYEKDIEKVYDSVLFSRSHTIKFDGKRMNPYDHNLHLGSKSVYPNEKPEYYYWGEFNETLINFMEKKGWFLCLRRGSYEESEFVFKHKK